MRPLADLLNAACANPKLILGGSPYDHAAKKVLALKLQTKMRDSQRFFLTDEVITAAVTLGLHHPNILLEVLHRARTPFDKVWLEWSVQAASTAAKRDILPGASQNTGCFVERMSDTGFRITVIEGPPDEKSSRVGVGSLSCYYDVLTPLRQIQPALVKTGYDVARLAGIDHDTLQRALVGSAYHSKFDLDADPEERGLRKAYCDHLTQHAAWLFNPMMAEWHRENQLGNVHRKQVVYDPDTGRYSEQRAADAYRIVLKQTVGEHAGVWRNVIAVLALINAQTFTESKSYRYGTTRSVAGRLLPYLEYRRVTLALPRKVVEERMVRSLVESIPKPARKVLGSYRQWHHRGDPNCDHPYIDVTPTRKRCPLCNHAIWWVDHYTRGDPEVGEVITDRVVTRT